MTGNRAIVISWIGYHGRSAALAAALNGEAIFVSESGGVLRRYVRSFAATARLVRANPLSPVIVMLPPVPALVAALLDRGDRRSRRVWADLHTGVFENPRWAWARRFTLRLIAGSCGGAIVTNESLAKRARSAGIKDVIVLHDILRPHGYTGGSTYVVFPVTYANDEPIESILAAAKLTPDITYVLTGRAPDWVKQQAPSNVRLPGFVSREEFELLLDGAGAIGALTDRPFTMQRAGYEALELGAPLITSPTDDLREYFGDSVQYADSTNSAGSIASAVSTSLLRHDEYREKMLRLRELKIDEQEHTLEALTNKLMIEARTS